MTAAVLGAGAWGTALARLLRARRHEVRLWARRPELAREIARAGENALYLPGIPVPGDIKVTDRLAEAVEAVELVLVVVPVQHIRTSLAAIRGIVPPQAIRVSGAKGIERMTHRRVSEILTDIWGPGRFVVLSGPSFALEVARGEPTAVTAASEDGGLARTVQQALSSERFRVYTSDDVVGVELAGALKNVIAIAAGIVRGLGLGSNALAALLTRGLAEVSRLGEALGGKPGTFLGLAGVGDLVLTCTGELSRNRKVGEAVAAGSSLEAITRGSRTVAEGVETARSVLELAQRTGIEMPITDEVVQVLFGGHDPKLALKRLMGRDLKAE